MRSHSNKMGQKRTVDKVDQSEATIAVDTK